MERKLKHNLVWVVVLLAATLLILVNHNRPAPYQKDSGLVFGTVYNITYQHKENLKAEIEQELRRFDGSLSPFNDTATITRVNRNEAVRHHRCSFGQRLGLRLPGGHFPGFGPRGQPVTVRRLPQGDAYGRGADCEAGFQTDAGL